MAVLFRSLLVICASLCLVLAKHEQYEGSAVYEVVVKDAYQAAFANDLENQIPVDIWVTPQPGRAGQFFITKEYKEQLEMLLSAANIEYKIVNANIKEDLEKEDELLAAAAARSSDRSTPALDYNQIHRYQVVDDYLVRLGNAYPSIVTVASAGRSFEGRDIKYLRISTTNFQDRSKPVVVFQSLLHAREWVTLPATLYAIEKLVIDVTENDLLNDIDWIIIPIVNPDGYEWTHTNSRFWRKNRATGLVAGNVCLGVDLNRNFDMHWGTASSNNVCSDTFHGRSAFSEPESQAVRRILSEFSNRIELYLDIHGVGSMILFGYGNGQLPPNGLALNYVGVNMAQAIDKVKWASNPNYIVGNIFNVLYAASGGASDYAQGVGIPLSYTYELPSYRNLNGNLNQFLVDPEFIEQAGYETWEGIKAGARVALSIFRQRQAEAK